MIRRCEPCNFECDETWSADTCPNCHRELVDQRNRSRIARERAGLSVSQAARSLGVEPRVIQLMEAGDVDGIYEEAITFAGRMADLYAVRLEWMLGEVDRYDYAAVNALPDADKLAFETRRELAETVASMPREKA